MPSLMQGALSGTGVPQVDLGEAFRHRQDFEDYVINKAQPTYRLHLERFYRLWHQYNRVYFASAMTPPYLMIDQPHDQLSYGGYEPITGFGGLTGIIVRESIVTQDHIDLSFGDKNPAGIDLLLEDIILHYATRQYCAEVLGKPDQFESGHGGTYVKECNRIGAILGLPDVGPARTAKRSKSGTVLPTCAHWPWNVRPAGYYYGAYDYTTVQAGRRQQKLQAAQKVSKNGVSGQALTLLNDEIDRLKQQLAQVTHERDQEKACRNVAERNRLAAEQLAQQHALDLLKTEAERDALLQAAQPLPTLADVKPILAQVIGQYGQAANFQALLNDYLPQQTLERHLLVTAWRAGYLKRQSNGEGSFGNYNIVINLTQAYGIRYELAQWAVETWSEALALAHVPVF